MPPIRFSREYATIVRTEGRRASHPVFGETVLSAHSSGPAHRYFDRGERAGLLTSESSSGPPFRPPRDSGISWAFVVRYSGATARDLHPVPYSPATISRALFRLSTLYIVWSSKNYTKCGGLPDFCQESSFQFFSTTLVPSPTGRMINRGNCFLKSKKSRHSIC
jgi:hypothetical protein